MNTVMNTDYQRIATAIRYLDDEAPRQPGLKELAAAIALSEFHTQRLFMRWAGISPKRFLQALTGKRAASLLRRGMSNEQAALDSGLSGCGRLHDLMINLYAMTPAQYKHGGRDLDIHYGRHHTPFGQALVAFTERGISTLEFGEEKDNNAARRRLAQRWPEARLHADAVSSRDRLEAVFACDWSQRTPLALHVAGSNFQLQVWRALLRIPAASCLSYGDIASDIGAPQAARAVGHAVGANPVAYLIPCHRVIRGTGVVGNYRWGEERKRAILTWETAREAAAD